MNCTKIHKKRLRMAKKIIIATRCTSISHLQRKMRISYSSAEILMNEISRLSGFRFLNKGRKHGPKKLKNVVYSLK